jgi:hypothetical protein
MVPLGRCARLVDSLFRLFVRKSERSAPYQTFFAETISLVFSTSPLLEAVRKL